MVVSGCLKLLPTEELERLDIPPRKESTDPVKTVLYISQNDSPFLGGTTTLSEQHTEATRFNLFTGNQTLDQRDTSFKVISCVAHILTRFPLITIIIVLKLKRGCIVSWVLFFFFFFRCF